VTSVASPVPRLDSDFRLPPSEAPPPPLLDIPAWLTFSPLPLRCDAGVRLPCEDVVAGWKKMPAGRPSGLWITMPDAPRLPMRAAVSLK